MYIGNISPASIPIANVIAANPIALHPNEQNIEIPFLPELFGRVFYYNICRYKICVIGKLSLLTINIRSDKIIKKGKSYKRRRFWWFIYGLH